MAEVSVDVKDLDKQWYMVLKTLSSIQDTKELLKEKYAALGAGWKDAKYTALGKVVNECIAELNKVEAGLSDVFPKLTELVSCVMEYENTNIINSNGTYRGYGLSLVNSMPQRFGFSNMSEMLTNVGATVCVNVIAEMNGVGDISDGDDAAIDTAIDNMSRSVGINQSFRHISSTFRTHTPRAEVQRETVRVGNHTYRYNTPIQPIGDDENNS